MKTWGKQETFKSWRNLEFISPPSHFQYLLVSDSDIGKLQQDSKEQLHKIQHG